MNNMQLTFEDKTKSIHKNLLAEKNAYLEYGVEKKAKDPANVHSGSKRLQYAFKKKQTH